MFLIISAFTFIITNVARIFHCVSAAVNTSAMATVIETFLVSASVVARIRHTIGDTFVRRTLSKGNGFSHHWRVTNPTVVPAVLGPPVELI